MIAKKKSDISNKTRKQNKKKKETPVVVTEQSVKDMFISEAKNTTFTEEDLKELEEAKAADKEVEETPEIVDEDTVGFVNDAIDMDEEELIEIPSNTIIEQVVVTDTDSASTETQEESYIPTVQFADHTDTDTCIGESVSYTCTANDYTIVTNFNSENTVTTVNPEEIMGDGVDVIIPEEPKKKEESKPKKKKRSTSTQVYGYHWMGQIFGE